MKIERVAKYLMTLTFALAVAVSGCESSGGGGTGGTAGDGGMGGDGGGPGGMGGDGGVGGGGTGGGGTGGGGTGGSGGVIDVSDLEQLDALIQAGVPLVAEIQGVTVSSPPVMEFSVATQSGTGITGIPEGSVRGTFAKLVPGATATQSSTWVSYINNLATGAGEEPALPQALQATREEGTLVDNGDGTYEFTYATDVTAVTEPVPVTWEPGNTTRAGIEIRLEDTLNPDNPTFDFVPDGGAGTGSRDISAMNLCNNCHQRLALHGDGRFTDTYCVTCHNDSTRDPDAGESVSQAYMIHSIHASEAREAAGEPYIVIGRRGTVHDYSEVTYPQDVRECTNCHNAADAPDGGEWATAVNALSCGGCHAGRLVEVSTDEVTGIGTYGISHIINDQEQVLEDAACGNCHNNPGTFPDLVTADRHVNQELVSAANYQYNIIDATNTNVGQMPEITFSITNPNDGDSAYDLNEEGGPFDTGTFGGAARVAVMLAWPTNDYTNRDTGSQVAGFRPGSPAQNVSMNPLGGNCPGESCVDNQNGTYTITSPVEVPAGLTGGSLAVAIEGHPAEDLGGESTARIPVTGAVAYYEISEAGGAGEAREIGVSLEKCADCHGSLLSLHGANRNNSLELCVTCHNPNATDIRARAEAGVAGEESVDFKTMIHGIHAANVVLYGFGGSVHDYTEVTYPGQLNNCGACHEDGTYYPTDPSTDFRLASTYISDNFENGAIPEDVVPSEPRTPERAATLANQEDDLNRTANAAACLQCHTTPTAESHTIVPGGAKLSVRQADDGTLIPAPNDPVPNQVETCVLCHGEGSSVSDTRDRHGVWFPLP